MVGDYIAHRDRTHISETYAGYLTDELEERLKLGGCSVESSLLMSSSADSRPDKRPR